MLYELARPLLFQLPPETAHHLAFASLALWQAALQRRQPRPAAPDPLLAQALWGLTFPNPLGLAAGFDKNGTLPHVWPALGFGFAELGTITALPQPGNPPPRLFRLPVEQALINLIRNAVDAVALSGHVSLGWRLDGSWLQIEIVDDGPGLPPSSKLFVPFFTTKPGGSGIGLVLTRQIIEQHGGTLSLQNRSDSHGCIACIRLPLT